MFSKNAFAGPAQEKATWLMLALVVAAIALPGLCALNMATCAVDAASCEHACAISGGTSATAFFSFLIFILPTITGVAPLFADRVVVRAQAEEAWRPPRRLFRPPKIA